MGIAFGITAIVLAFAAVVNALNNGDTRAAGVACVLCVAFLAASVLVLRA